MLANVRIVGKDIADACDYCEKSRELNLVVILFGEKRSKACTARMCAHGNRVCALRVASQENPNEKVVYMTKKVFQCTKERLIPAN